MKEEQFATAMKHLAIAFNKIFTKDEIEVYYSYLNKYSFETLKRAVNEIVLKEKFMPKISEIIIYCEENKNKIRFEILEIMNLKGYFANVSEYEKASEWLENNIIPEWFKEDMKKYKQQYLQTNEKMMLNS